MIGRHIAYARYVIRHKWFVLQACVRTGAGLWRGMVHDLSKLTPSEWGPYARTFYGPGGESRYQKDPLFQQAWLYHQRRNRHHHQYWVLQKDDGTLHALEMPEVFVREMVADWIGAGKAISQAAVELGSTDARVWYAANKDKMVLHQNTRKLVEELLL